VANKSLFTSVFGKLLAQASARNEAGGVAYARSPKQALAQYVATGCLNATYYAGAQEQLARIIELADKVEPEFLARLALYARGKAHMKDTPALLVALLSVRSPGLMAEVFDRVIDTPRMLRTFVQIMRSGAVGRKSLGTLPKRLVQQWLQSRSDEQLFRASVGNAPSLADVIRMVHPRPATPSRAALYAYLVGKDYEESALPELVKAFEAFKAEPEAFPGNRVPPVPMDMLTALALSGEHWCALAEAASWHSLRMNLNTFARHGVFADEGAVRRAADKLRDAAEIARARVLPFQLLAAHMNVDQRVPVELTEALQDAMELAIGNVPTLTGRVWVCPDVSGSMHSPVTGARGGATTKVRCIDVASLVAAAVVRNNLLAGVLPFSDAVVPVRLNPRDSVMTNARVLAALPSGGTNCAAPLELLNKRGDKGDLVIYVSDNQSWIGAGNGAQTPMMVQWRSFKRRNPGAKLVCLDVQPSGTTQAPECTDTLNIGGFADSVFTVMAEFYRGTLSNEHWVGVIDKESI
jgi:60 kDa SS-A/Ro ribonucleoprotein